jgi:hypothetical protein
MVREHLGAKSEWDGNIATEYGTLHEEGALIDFKLETGLGVKEAGFLVFEDWLGASPDGLTSDGGVLEIKAPFGKRKDVEPVFSRLSDQPHYYAQVQVEILCANASHGWFFQWAPNGISEEWVPRDFDWVNKNLPILRQFHAEFIDTINSPELSAPHLDPKRVEIDTPEMRQRLAEYDDLVEAIEQAEARKKELLASFVEMAKGRDASLCGRNLTRVERAGAIAYAKAVKDLLPKADLEPYRGKPSEYWQLK